ncbi:hypothetical protein HDU98_006551 [Podochytrium sp. JEL0797]|nr:hypothetical protein HDU98_006551 [Podochytrium sp. JEL0797]
MAPPTTRSSARQAAAASSSSSSTANPDSANPPPRLEETQAIAPPRAAPPQAPPGPPLGPRLGGISFSIIIQQQRDTPAPAAAPNPSAPSAPPSSAPPPTRLVHPFLERRSATIRPPQPQIPSAPQHPSAAFAPQFMSAGGVPSSLQTIVQDITRQIMSQHERMISTGFSAAPDPASASASAPSSSSIPRESAPNPTNASANASGGLGSFFSNFGSRLARGVAPTATSTGRASLSSAPGEGGSSSSSMLGASSMRSLFSSLSGAGSSSSSSTLPTADADPNSNGATARQQHERLTRLLQSHNMGPNVVTTAPTDGSMPISHGAIITIQLGPPSSRQPRPTPAGDSGDAEIPVAVRRSTRQTAARDAAAAAGAGDGGGGGGGGGFGRLEGVTVYGLNNGNTPAPVGGGGGGARAGAQNFASLPEALNALLEGLTWNLMQAVGNAHMQGQPPASDSAIAGLEVVRVDAGGCGSNKRKRGQDEKCLVCQDEFFREEPAVEGEEEGSVLRMPCWHLFHEVCLKPWLKTSNTCPTCRYEIMTDNAEYNVGVAERMAARSASTAGAEESVEQGGINSGGDVDESDADDSSTRKRRRLN